MIGEFRFQTGRFAVWKHIPPFNVSILMIGDMKSRTEEAFFIAPLKPCKPKAYLCKKVRTVSVFTETKPFKTFQKQDLKVHDHQKKTYIFRKTTNRNKHTQNQENHGIRYILDAYSKCKRMIIWLHSVAVLDPIRNLIYAYAQHPPRISKITFLCFFVFISVTLIEKKYIKNSKRVPNIWPL